MKQILKFGFLALFLGMAIVACSQPKKNIVVDPAGKDVQLTIHIAKADAKRFVKLMIFEGEEPVTIDSFQVDKKGNFIANVKISEPSFFVVDLNDEERYALLILNDEAVTVDFNEEGVATVTGGADNAFYKEFETISADIQTKGAEYRERYFAAASEEAQATVAAEYEAFINEAKANLIGFIGRAKNSIVAINASNMLDPEVDFDIMSDVANHLASKYPNVQIVQEFKGKIDKYTMLAIGKMAPDFKLKANDGTEIALSSLRGKYVMIDFWASWCGPCRQENPHVVKMYNQFKDKGFEIIGVSLDEDEGAWTEAIKADELPWKHVIDSSPITADLYNISGIPYTYLLDKEGNIIAKGLRSEAMTEKLTELLSK